jgi:hypothetical protein
MPGALAPFVRARREAFQSFAKGIPNQASSVRNQSAWLHHRTESSGGELAGINVGALSDVGAGGRRPR